VKLKYYLRGLGIGIIITTLVLMIAYSGHKTELTDAEIIARAESLGMVMKEDPLFSNSESVKDTAVTDNSETSTEQVTEAGSESETEIVLETETEAEPESETATEAETEKETTEAPETETVQTGDIYHLIIPSGSYPRLICNELQDNGVIEDAAALRKYLADMGFATSIKVGEYEIPYGATNEEVYQILKAGPL